jgi:ApbE superfamily uncharacterized protein (UPF0280 family)
MIETRFYRKNMGDGRFRSFTIGYKDSDLWIGIDPKSFNESIPQFAQQLLVTLRKELENYILTNPEFVTSFTPIHITPLAPKIALEMALAGQKAGTGPMAAVAGAFAEFVGKTIISEFGVKEIVVENGGDIFLSVRDDLVFSVYAGKSVLSGKIGIEIKASESPLGICTSSGIVGPSISFGNADAVVVISKNAATADAYATAIGNRIKHYSDIEIEINKINEYPEILFLLTICEENIGLKGNFPIKPLKGENN